MKLAMAGRIDTGCRKRKYWKIQFHLTVFWFSSRSSLWYQAAEVGYIIPVGRYFLNCLCYGHTKCVQWGKQKLANWDRKDLELWLNLLQSVTQSGISLNHLNFMEPTDICITDACEHGLGGFHMGGLVWRWQIPPDLQGIFSINLLEFLASVINIWMIGISCGTERKILNYTDSSSTLGWLFKSCFNPVEFPIHDTVARKLALL